MKKFKPWQESSPTRRTFILLFLLAMIIESISMVQYFYARNGISMAAQINAEKELQLKSLEVQKVMTAVETAVENSAWIIEHNISNPDTLWGLLQRVVENTPAVIGCEIGFEPNYYPQYGYWFEPYVPRLDDGKFGRMQVGSEKHQYHMTDWYVMAKSTGKGYWSEPYFDAVGRQDLTCTYGRPMRDKSGKIVGVIGADVSLGWLSDVINPKQTQQSSYNLLLSRSGKIVACPVESLIMRSALDDVAAMTKDTAVNRVNRDLKSRQSGKASVVNEKGEKDYIFYAPVEGKTGWSVVVIRSHKDVYGSLKRVSTILYMIMLLGLVLLGYLLYRTVKGYGHIQSIQAEKESISRELKIASDIQMGMVPKSFPPYPERNDVGIFASLTPAKEVGGDLYDFYIRDEKLFFCIGDVAGKGVPASLVMAVTRSLFRTISAHEASPSRILTILNDSMSETNKENMFVTLFVGVLDLPTGRLHYSNAGHEIPILIGDGIGPLYVDTNIPVGITAGWKYTAQDTLILPQTCIFLYTDGLTDAENSEHERFSEERVLDVIEKTVSENQNTPDLLIGNMTTAVQHFVDGTEQSDDLTMLTIQYSKQALDVRLQRVLVLENDVQQIPKLATFVDEVCEAVGFDMTESMQMNLAIEEAVVNVMNYAYSAGVTGNVEIEAQANDERLKFVITDNGSPFDPTSREEVDTTLSVEDRPIGGLGIFLVRQLMDSINYERLDGKNVLTLRKQLKKNNESS